MILDLVSIVVSKINPGVSFRPTIITSTLTQGLYLVINKV